MPYDENRRQFLHATMTGAGLLVVGATAFAADPEKKRAKRATRKTKSNPKTSRQPKT